MHHSFNDRIEKNQEKDYVIVRLLGSVQMLSHEVRNLQHFQPKPREGSSLNLLLVAMKSVKENVHTMESWLHKLKENKSALPLPNEQTFLTALLTYKRKHPAGYKQLNDR